jgi:ATP-binding cassette subfamily B protein
MSHKNINPILFSLKCLYKHKYKIIILILDVIFASLFSFIPSYIIKHIIEGLTICKSYDVLIPYIQPYIVFYFLFFLIAIIVFRLYDYFIQVHTFPQMKKEIILEKYCLLIQQNKEYFQENFSGEIAEKIDDLQKNVIELIKLFFSKIFIHVLSIIFVCGGLLYYNYYCGLVIVIWILVFLCFAIFFGKKIAKISSQWANDSSMLNGILVDILSNAMIVRLFNNNRHEEDNIKKQAELIQDREMTIEWYFLLGWTLYSVSFFIVQALSFYILLQQYKTGMVSAADFAFVWTMNSSIVNILWRFLRDFVEFPEYYSIIRESLRVLDQEIKIKNLTDRKLIVSKGEINFNNVSFSFEKNVIFDNFTLHIKPRQKVGLVGFSGSGKTTFINLLLRLYEIDAGSILIDNQNIKDITLESLYDMVSLIPQEPCLLHRTILDNVLYGKHDANEKELAHCIKLSALDQFIANLPNGYSTMVGERGSRMSGGQKQRVAIARAYLKDAPILILDEATSHLDSVTENLIQQNLEEMMNDKTVLVIAHRLSTIEKMDRIIVFDKGKIIQDGTHIELMKEDGLYKKFWEVQAAVLPEE